MEISHHYFSIQSVIAGGFVLINVYNIERVPPVMSILKMKSANRLRTIKENVPIFSTYYHSFSCVSEYQNIITVITGTISTPLRCNVDMQ